VIYEVYPANLSSDGVESSLDIISNDKIDLDDFKMALSINNIRTYNTLLYAFMFGNFKNRTFNEKLNKGKDTYVSGGYVEREMSFYQPPTASKKVDKKWNLKKYQLKNVESILEKIHQENKNIILVFAPITKSRYKNYSNNEEFDELMEAYAKKYDATYYNFNKILNVNDSLHYYDSSHLNQDGVEFFNKALIKELGL
jgi:hypothetical protein